LEIKTVRFVVLVQRQALVLEIGNLRHPLLEVIVNLQSPLVLVTHAKM